MSSVYRILVDSSKRQTGHMFDFAVDVSRVSTSTDFRSKSWMCAVEWCDIVRYSEGLGSDYTAVDLHPRCLLLTCPSLRQNNTYKSWSACSGSTLCMLQSYMGYGIFRHVRRPAVSQPENAWLLYSRRQVESVRSSRVSDVGRFRR